MIGASRICLWLLLLVVCESCGMAGIEVAFYRYDGYIFSPLEQRTIERIAGRAVSDARRLLPDLPEQLILRVNTGQKVMPETGQTGSVSQPNVVYWVVDPSRHGGVIAIRTRLR